MNKVVEIDSAKKPRAKLDKRAAQSLINDYAKDSGKVRMTKHIRERMTERDFVYNDVLTILRDGVVREDPTEDNGQWLYKVEFIKFNGSRDAACVVKIDENKEQLRAITVMWVDWR